MSELPKDVEDKLIRARIFLFSNHPFFAQLAMYLDPRPSNNIPTVGVDPDGKLWVNVEFLRKATIRDCVWILAHEVMHLVTMTSSRQPAKSSHSLFNIASDIVINYIITDCSKLELPTRTLIEPWHKTYDRKLAKYEGWITEDVYYDLVKDQDPNSGDDADEEGDGGESGGDSSDGEDTTNQGSSKPGSGKWHDDSASRCSNDGPHKNMTEEQESMWKGRIASAATAAKASGNLPGALDTFICKLLAPKRDWRKELRYQMSSHLKGRWTWRKIGRRTAGTVRTPGRDPEPPTACCYFDTSGSMSDDALIRCFSEGAEIARLCGGKVYIILGDSQVYYQGKADVNAFKKLPVQRGGTDFRVVFEAIKKSDNPNPDIFIGFTDLYGPFPKEKPSFPVIWCCPEKGHHKAPWGKVVEINS